MYSLYALSFMKGLWGKRTVNVVPMPSWLSKVTVPPNASVIRFITAKPNPWPFDLVVNIGVNNLSLTFSDMPTPVSLTVNMKSFSSLKDCIVVCHPQASPELH